MKYVSRASGQLKSRFEVLALGEICFEGMGRFESGDLRCWHWVKCVLRAWGQLKTESEVLVLCEIGFQGMGTVEKGVGGVGIG